MPNNRMSNKNKSNKNKKLLKEKEKKLIKDKCFEEEKDNIINEICNNNFSSIKKGSFKIILNKGYDICMFCYHMTYKTLRVFFKISGIYLLWIMLHFVASHLYIDLCVPKTIVGLLISPFLMSTPHCQGLRWIVFNAANVINNMWIIVGAWICSYLIVSNKTSGHDMSGH